MIKHFPKSRISVIDVYPALIQGIQKAILFTSKHNITLNSLDGRKLLFDFCAKTIKDSVNAAKCPYPKVCCIGVPNTSNKMQNFINGHFAKIIDFCSVPYCGKLNLTSPDLEAAARNSLNRKQNYKKEFNELLQTLNLRNV